MIDLGNGLLAKLFGDDRVMICSGKAEFSIFIKNSMIKKLSDIIEQRHEIPKMDAWVDEQAKKLQDLQQQAEKLGVKPLKAVHLEVDDGS